MQATAAREIINSHRCPLDLRKLCRGNSDYRRSSVFADRLRKYEYDVGGVLLVRKIRSSVVYHCFDFSCQCHFRSRYDRCCRLNPPLDTRVRACVRACVFPSSGRRTRKTLQEQRRGLSSRTSRFRPNDNYTRRVSIGGIIKNNYRAPGSSTNTGARLQKSSFRSPRDSKK